MSSAAYARVAEQISSPRQIEAKALLKAARKLQDVQANWEAGQQGLEEALTFNRKLWSLFVSSVLRDDNPQPVEVRQNIANIAVFILNRTVDIQLEPSPEKLKSLIDINCNIAAGLNT